VTATLPARAEARYRGVVYGIDILDHETGLVVPNDYVGKTRQRGRARENQHRDDKPWSDRIVGSSHVLWEDICTETELDEMERKFIRELGPRMNDKDNRGNRKRIPYAVQVRQRHERDDAAGRPRWLPLEQRQRSSLLEWDDRRSVAIGVDWRVSVPQSWSPVQVKTGLWSMAWLLSTILFWGELARHGPWSTLVDALAGCGIAGGLLLWAVLRPRDTRRMWRRRWRRLRRAVR
jgi:hypothetical protein